MVFSKFRVVVGAGLVVLLSACGGSTSDSTGGGGVVTNPPTVTPVQTTAVIMQGQAFNPANIRVSPGATVTFTNQDGIAHNVTFTTGGITSSGDFSTGTKSIVMPATAGTYGFRCTIHAGMSGTVLVQ